MELRGQRERENRSDPQRGPRLPGKHVVLGNEAKRQDRHLKDVPIRAPVRGERAEANQVPGCAGLEWREQEDEVLAVLAQSREREFVPGTFVPE